jgi:hypothetical protein
MSIPRFHEWGSEYLPPSVILLKFDFKRILVDFFQESAAQSRMDRHRRSENGPAPSPRVQRRCSTGKYTV